MCDACQETSDVKRLTAEANEVVRNYRTRYRQALDTHFSLPPTEYSPNDIKAQLRSREKLIDLIGCLAGADIPSRGLSMGKLLQQHSHRFPTTDQTLAKRIELGIEFGYFQKSKPCLEDDDGRKMLVRLTPMALSKYLDFIDEVERFFSSAKKSNLTIENVKSDVDNSSASSRESDEDQSSGS